jgi:hypothetical protein
MDNKTGYNPVIHHRKSTRLKGYDYSQNGLYFITICTNIRKEQSYRRISEYIIDNPDVWENDKFYRKASKM